MYNLQRSTGMALLILFVLAIMESVNFTIRASGSILFCSSVYAWAKLTRSFEKSLVVKLRRPVFLVADTWLYTLLRRTVGPSGRQSITVLNSERFGITAPAQPSVTGLPCIRPCCASMIWLSTYFCKSVVSPFFTCAKFDLSCQVAWYCAIGYGWALLSRNSIDSPFSTC